MLVEVEYKMFAKSEIEEVGNTNFFRRVLQMTLLSTMTTVDINQRLLRFNKSWQHFLY